MTGCEHSIAVMLTLAGNIDFEVATCSAATDFRLVQAYDVAFVSTGDVLRREIAAKSPVGRKAEAVVASGGGSMISGY